MDNRNNTIIGWVLGAAIVALGGGSLAGHLWKAHDPHTPGYAVAGAESGGGGGAAAVPIATLLATADVAAGEQVFKKCAACHTIAAGGPNGIGPNLHGVMGEGVGAGRGGYAFSDALKAVGGSWTFEQMDAWLTSPRRFANGTKMSFAGLSDGQERANLIAYLNAQGSNLPLPAAPVAAAPAEGDTSADGAAPAGAAAGGAVDPAQAGAAAPAAGAAATTAQPATKN